MTQREKEEYVNIKEKISRTEKRVMPLFVVCFIILFAAVILSEVLWKYLLYIAIGAFIVFVAAYSLYLLSLNKKLKKYEKKLISNGGKNEKE